MLSVDLMLFGDVINTGAGANQQSELDLDRFWDVVTGKTSHAFPVSKISLLPDTSRELSNPLAFVLENFVDSVSAKYFNDEDATWVSQVGAEYGIAPENIYLAARNGERSLSAVKQIDRVLTKTSGVAPDVLAVYFSTNDVCAAMKQMIVDDKIYIALVSEALEYFFKQAKPKIPNGKILLPAPINLTQFVNEKTIQDKEVYAHGKQTSCKELRTVAFRASKDYSPENIEVSPLINVVPPNPATYCATLFNPKIATKETVQAVATMTKSYRVQLKKLASEMSRKLKSGAYRDFQGWSVVYSASSSEIIFDPSEVSNDCFHLSAKGQSRLATSILKDMRKN